MEKFLKEMNRRGVPRVAAAYAVVAWIIIQVVTAVLPPLGVPDWMITGTIVLSALGFPIAIAVAWIYEWTPAGVKTQVEADAAGIEVVTAIGRQIDFVIIALLVIAVGWLIWQLEKPSPIADRSIAVLPFASFSQAVDDEDFADGLTEELLNVLAKLPDLKVAGRTSSFYYKGKTPDLREAGRQLGVAYVLEGSVRRSGKMLRITTQLIQVEDGFHLWSETYDRPFEDIFAVQDDIAKRVASVMQIKLLGEDLARVMARGTMNAEAHSLYMIARAKARTRKVGELTRSVALLEKALEIDPEYADAWASLARNRILVAAANETLTPEVYSRAFGEIDRALSIDPNSSDAWAAKGLLLADSGGYSGGGTLSEQTEEAFEKALELDPDNVEALHHFGIFHMQRMNYEPALALFDRAVETDPLYSRVRFLRAVALRRLGETKLAREIWVENTVYFPEAPNSWDLLFDLEVRRGHLHHGVVVLEQAFRVSEMHFMKTNELAALYWSLGADEEAEQALQRLREAGLKEETVELVRLVHKGQYEEIANRYAASDINAIPEYMAWWILDATLAAGKFEAAEKHVLRNEEMEQLSDFSPADAHRFNRIESLNFAWLLQAKGEADKAAALWEKILSVTEVIEYPDVMFSTSIKAMALAAWGKSDLAMEQLELLYEMGYRGAAFGEITMPLQDYVFFDPMRETPAFQAYLARMEKDRAAMLAELRQGIDVSQVQNEPWD